MQWPNSVREPIAPVSASWSRRVWIALRAGISGVTGTTTASDWLNSSVSRWSTAVPASTTTTS